MSHLPADKPTLGYATGDQTLPPARIVTRDGWFRRVREFFYEFLIGATLSWVLVPYQIRKRQEMEQLITLIFSTDILGIPVLPPRDRLRLLPYILPRLMHWRRMTIFDRAIEGADLRHLGH
jgi:hypothetical protein